MRGRGKRAGEERVGNRETGKWREGKDVKG